MSQKADWPLWIDEAMKLWDADVSDELRERLKALAEKSVEILSRVEQSKLQGWRQEWIAYLLERSQAVAEGRKDLFEVEEPDEEAPKWQWALWEDYAKTAVPTVNVKALQQRRPSQSPVLTFGELVGHEHACWHPDNPGLRVATEKLSGEFGEIIRLQIEFLRARRLAWVDRAMEIAKRQSLKEWQQFSRGYSLAIQKGTLDPLGVPVGATLAWPICSTMVMFSDFVPKLSKTRELFEWLQALVGKSTLKDSNGLKRVEKYCERIGLSFRPPGRPAKE